MAQWSKERIQVTGMLIVLFFMSLFIYPLIVDNENLHLSMSVSFVFIVFFTFIFGLVLGLMATLLYIFVFGSALFFVHLTDSVLFPSLIEFPIVTFFFLSLVLLVVVLVAGSLHRAVLSYDHDTRVMKRRMNEWLTIDRVTGFDSKGRFMKDLQSELSRATRYNESLSLVMLELDYYAQFRKLYGEQEATTMIQSLAKTMEALMRLSDRKYRLNDQRFVLLLPNTDETGTAVVLSKLKEALMDYKLQKEKTVTLYYHASTFTYDGIPITKEEIVQVMESELRSGAL